ncbi:hypothetical protein CTI12_AA444350 [Artemisia annua]|uniref:Uncharacterized protein n=1 Tax=Artemisia annua TaxID=35608 RepID=A0A2U1LWN9_ARTAN|nr:hypothetical protein CTI12_AA444350 [Artemisia annua]
MESDIDYGNEMFKDKMVIRKAIEDAKIPYTYISANDLGAYFVGNLAQFGSLVPLKDQVSIYGDGNCKDRDDGIRAVLAIMYHIFYEGLHDALRYWRRGEEASKLYPEVQYTRMDEYLERDL